MFLRLFLAVLTNLNDGGAAFAIITNRRFTGGGGHREHILLCGKGRGAINVDATLKPRVFGAPEHPILTSW